MRRAVRILLISLGLSPLVVAFLPPTMAAPFLGFFRLQCHGLVDRVLTVFGHQLPVCSRCTGIYLGLALAAALPRPRFAPSVLRVWLFAAAALMALDALVLEDRVPALRILTGLLLAWPVVKLVLPEPSSPVAEAPVTRSPTAP